MSEHRKLRLAMPLLLSVMMAVGMMIGYVLKARSGNTTLFMTNEPSSPLQEVLSLVRQQYVDENSVDSVEQVLIEDLLGRLDPHSVFIPAAEAEAVKDDLQGQFGGVGIEYQVLNDTVTITGVMAGGPSAKAGLLPGDQLLGVAGKNFSPDSSLTQQVRKALKGSPGTSVKVVVRREGRLLQPVLTRALIPLPAVSASYMVNDTTGYIGLTKFSETAYPEFMQALEGLQKTKKLRHLILDLRGNGGGLLGAAVNIADEFLSDNKLVTYTQGAHNPKMEYRCKRPGLYEEGKLTVLIDQGSASASEILAGALQDWDRATLIGRRSFGKGLVQQQYNLSGGNELRLTVARYYTPLGRNIQKSYAGGLEAYKAEVENRPTDSVYLADTSLHREKFRTPNGHILYGNGGISPDIVAKSDSNLYLSLPMLNLFKKGIPTQAALTYWNTNKTKLKALSVFSALAADKTVRQEILTLATKLDPSDMKQLSPAATAEMIRQSMAQLAKMRFGTAAGVEMRNYSDPVVQMAVSL